MIKHIKPDASKIPGFYEPNMDMYCHLTKTNNAIHYFDRFAVIDNFLSTANITNLLRLFNEAPVKEPVSIQGLKDVPSEKGSERTTMWSEELAEQLTEKLLNTNFRKDMYTNQFTRTDCWQKVSKVENMWDLVGFSPLLRFMEYKHGGQHYAHYDAGYIYEDPSIRSLKSIVIYLTTNSTGATRLIHDNQDLIAQSERNNNDWDKETDSNLVYFSNLPVAGNAFIFNHRICHDVDKFLPPSKDESRIIIRGDLIYKLR